MLAGYLDGRASLNEGFTAARAATVRRVRWWGPLGLLAAVRVAIPLAAYADEGSRLPGMPRFERSDALGGLMGDATGFYSATREFLAGWARMPRPLLALLVVVALAVAAAFVLGWRRRPGLRP